MTADAPPPLADMAARKAALEAERAELFPKWKAALEDAKGNVTHAGRAAFPEADPKTARNRARRRTQRLGLVEYAQQLRVAATGHARGRQDR